MNIEIHAKRGETTTTVDFPAPETLRLTIQMGTPKEQLESLLSQVLHAPLVEKLVRLWSDPDHPREFTEDGRHLFIRDSA